MKKQLVYVHGGDSFSEYDAFLRTLKERELRDVYGEGGKRWPDTLRPELREQYEIFTPMMPNKQNARYEEWKIWFERHIPHFTGEVTLIGWSLGGSFLAKYLSENAPSFHTGTVFLIAAPFVTKTPSVNEIEFGDFTVDPQLLPTIEDKVGKVVLMHSEDDFVVPYSHLERFVGALPQAEVVRFTDRNHFLQDTFPEVLDQLRPQ